MNFFRALFKDLKLSGWVSCGDWSCSAPIQEGIARLNFIGVKTSEDIDWLIIRSGETIVVTGKDAGTFKGQQLLCGYIKGKEKEKGFGIFPNSVIRVLRDKMNSLGARRYWNDLQEEKRIEKATVRDIYEFQVFKGGSEICFFLF